MTPLADPLEVLVVDDEPAARTLIAGYVSRHPSLSLAAVADSGTAALAVVEASFPDVMMLDIEMPGLDGFALLGTLTARGITPPRVVFVTAFDRYAVRAFDEHAVDYLMKPVSEDRFRQAVDRLIASETPPVAVQPLLEDALRLPPQRLLVRDRGRIVPVPVDQVDWIEADGNYVRLHTKARRFLVEKSLNDLERLLEPRGFVRVHRGAIVNLDRVRELRSLSSARYRLLLEDGTELIVSRSYSARFKGDLL